jgi:hypothetical protein
MTLPSAVLAPNGKMAYGFAAKGAVYRGPKGIATLFSAPHRHLVIDAVNLHWFTSRQEARAWLTAKGYCRRRRFEAYA